MACLELFFVLDAYIISSVGIQIKLKTTKNKTTIHLKVTHAVQQKISLNINKPT